MARMIIHETVTEAAAPVVTELACDDGIVSLVVAGEVLPLPEGALFAVMKRYGKPLDVEVRDDAVNARLDLGDGARVVRFRFLSRYDVIAHDYLVLYADGAEPLCELATSVTAALDFLARRLRAALSEAPD